MITDPEWREACERKGLCPDNWVATKENGMCLHVYEPELEIHRIIYKYGGLTMENMKLYEQAREVPENAKRPISAGRLKGKTDINPMWRIKKLTEMFGPVGIGWWYEIVDKQILYDEITHQKAAFLDILLYYVDPKSGETSKGIPGTGGSSFVSQEKSSPYLSDECFKMALTDAISVAAKAIGVGADVYFAADVTKYNTPPQTPPPAQKRQNQPMSMEQAENYVFKSGKYAGRTMVDVYANDPGYIHQLMANDQTPKSIKSAISIFMQGAKNASGI